MQIIDAEVFPKLRKFVAGFVAGLATWGLTFIPVDIPEHVEAGVPVLVATAVFYLIPEDYDVEVITAEETPEP